MTEIFTKAEYGRRLGVGPSAISNYIARGQLSQPAIRPDGMIDAALADAQLKVTVDVIRQAGHQSRRGRKPFRGETVSSGSLAKVPAAEPIDFGASRDLLRARATLAQIDAERRRRDFQHEIGRYMLTEAAEKAWTAELADLLLEIEGRFVDLAAAIGNDRQTIIQIRKWWRALRLALAKRNAEAAASLPEFVGDDREAL